MGRCNSKKDKSWQCAACMHGGSRLLSVICCYLLLGAYLGSQSLFSWWLILRYSTGFAYCNLFESTKFENPVSIPGHHHQQILKAQRVCAIVFYWSGTENAVFLLVNNQLFSYISPFYHSNCWQTVNNLKIT